MSASQEERTRTTLDEIIDERNAYAVEAQAAENKVKDLRETVANNEKRINSLLNELVRSKCQRDKAVNATDSIRKECGMLSKTIDNLRAALSRKDAMLRERDRDRTDTSQYAPDAIPVDVASPKSASEHFVFHHDKCDFTYRSSHKPWPRDPGYANSPDEVAFQGTSQAQPSKTDDNLVTLHAADPIDAAAKTACETVSQCMGLQEKNAVLLMKLRNSEYARIALDAYLVSIAPKEKSMVDFLKQHEKSTLSRRRGLWFLTVQRPCGKYQGFHSEWLSELLGLANEWLNRD
jgi:hypothetical protein